MELKKLKLFIISVLLSITLGSVFIGAAFADGISIDLMNQIPNPVTPGNFVYLNVKVSAVGDIPIKNVDIKFIPNQYFKIASGYSSEKFIDVVPAYGYSSTAYYVEKFKVYVEPNTPLGFNTINFVMTHNGAVYKYNFNVLVEDKNPNIKIENITLDKNYLEPGKSGKISFVVENPNPFILKNLVISLGLDKVQGNIISTVNNSNEVTIDYLKPYEKKKITYVLLISPDADSKPYLLPINVVYQDTLNNQYIKTLFFSVKVFSKPYIFVALDSQSSYTTGKSKVTISVSNPGSSTIKGTILKVLPSPSGNYIIIDGANQYVGDLNPDDFQTVQSDIYVENTKDPYIYVEVEYFDSYNNLITKKFKLPLKIFSEKQLEQLNMSNETNSWLIYLGIILLILAGFFYIEKKKKSKNKK